jgi:hypothetical protein
VPGCPYISIGKIKSKGIQIKFSESLGTLGILPRVGDHQAEILNSLGYKEDIRKLQEKVIF